MKKTQLGWIVAGAIVIVLALAGGVTALVLSGGGDPTSVQQVADKAVDAAEDLDVDAGIDLLCEAPSSDDRSGLNEMIKGAQDESGTDDPDVDYEISHVEGDAEGSFDVHVTSTEDEFEGKELNFRVIVERDGDRSCIADAAAID
ncbi:MAG: hypothetical protein L0H31_06665 [Nocardioidaceae bacterium]|nr:hypothetical protein [Nocardioidaceae bacterium]